VSFGNFSTHRFLLSLVTLDNKRYR